MKSFAVLAMCCAGAQAFAPVPKGSFGVKAAPARAASSSSTTVMMAKSRALPFLDSPSTLDGSMVGDFGFDPLGLTENINIPYGKMQGGCTDNAQGTPEKYCVASSYLRSYVRWKVFSCSIAMVLPLQSTGYIHVFQEKMRYDSRELLPTCCSRFDYQLLHSLPAVLKSFCTYTICLRFGSCRVMPKTLRRQVSALDVRSMWKNVGPDPLFSSSFMFEFSSRFTFGTHRILTRSRRRGKATTAGEFNPVYQSLDFMLI